MMLGQSFRIDRQTKYLRQYVVEEKTPTDALKCKKKSDIRTQSLGVLERDGRRLDMRDDGVKLVFVIQ